MNEDFWKYAYVKRPLTEIWENEDDVPDEWYLEWLKDKYDYQRPMTDEEWERMRALTLEQRMEWLEQAVQFVWTTKLAARNKRRLERLEK